MVTVAPGSGSPCALSTTRPATPPVVTWACTAPTATSRRRQNRRAIVATARFGRHSDIRSSLENWLATGPRSRKVGESRAVSRLGDVIWESNRSGRGKVAEGYTIWWVPGKTAQDLVDRPH